MPRPAAKRNRLAKVVVPAKGTAKHDDPSEHDGHDLEGVSSKQPSVKKTSESQHTQDTEQQPKNQTPTTRRRDDALGSTPAGERLASSGRPPTRARGYSSNVSLGGRKHDMNSKIPGTPAAENSVLSKFRRRPRQTSILQMMQAEDGGSDLDGDDDFLAGLSPDDESTPMNLARQKSLQAQQDATSLPESLSTPSTDGSRKRKRTAEEFQVPGSPSDIVENTQPHSPLPDNNDDESSASVSSPPLPENAVALSQTMAAPESSSPVHSPAHTLSGRGPGQFASEAAEPTKDGHRDAIPLSTEALQGKVLPRRRARQHRYRNGSDFEVPSDEDDYAERDDDELSRVPAKSSKPRGKQTQKSKPLAESAAKSKPTYPKQSKSRVRRTFGKENSVPPESAAESSPSSPNPPGRFMSEELEAQSRKFAEIDQWSMEFEDVAVPGSQASPTG
ncbi:hypothetical protein PHISP_01395 [Aspergillus sp. HF37]|nr:hypothetical protein PHISP_01395 [Aspergillus sp. HF37]